MEDERYLILGSNSFSGSSFINYLLDKNEKVIGISRSKEKKFLNPYVKNNNIKNFKFYRLDINLQQTKINNLVKKFKPKYILNFAALGMVNESWKFPDQWYQTNLVAMTKLVQNLSKMKFIKIFLNFSTPEVYGNINNLMKEKNNFIPTTPYAISRAAFDFHLNNLFKFYKFPVIITRTANVFGPYQDLYRVIPKTILSILNNKQIEIHGTGNTIRSFIHIDNVSSALYKIIKKGKIGDTYHISTDEFISIKNLCKIINKKLNKKKLKIKYTRDRTGKDFAYKLNTSKLKNTLKWKNSLTLNKSLDITIGWYKKNFDILKNLKITYEHKK